MKSKIAVVCRILLILVLSAISANALEKPPLFWLFACLFFTLLKVEEIYQSISRTERNTKKTLELINHHLERLDKIATAIYTEDDDEGEDDDSPTRISIN